VTATLKFAVDVDRCLEWTVGNVMKVCPSKSKAVSFTRSRVKETLNYFWRTEEFHKRAAANIWK
jgi:hypothetical protein